MKFCIACGMPLMQLEDYAGGDQNSLSCVYCTDEDGQIKSCDEIFEGGVQFFVSATGSSREEAEKLVRKNMRALPYWQDKATACLNGAIATDIEFQNALEKIKH